MIKVKLEIILNDSWDGYLDCLDETLVEDLITTIQDQRTLEEEVKSITIKSKHKI